MTTPATGRDGSLVQALQEALERGQTWREALDHLESTGVIPAEPGWPPSREHANWVWLADLDHRDRAVDFGSPWGATAVALSTHFRTVVHVSESRTDATCAALRFRMDACRNVAAVAGPLSGKTLQPGSFDCVVTHLRDRAMRVAFEKNVASLHGLLRPGGYLCVTAPRAWGNVGGVLRAAGLGDVHAFYAEMIGQTPRFLIPQTRAAVRAFEATRRVPGRRATLRKYVAGFAPLGLLYQAMLTLARR